MHCSSGVPNMEIFDSTRDAWPDPSRDFPRSLLSAKVETDPTVDHALDDRDHIVAIEDL